MTPHPRCDDIRREILAAGPLGDAPRAHLAECRACRLFAARLAIVDDGLEADAERAATTPLSASLRARILTATHPGLRALPLASEAGGALRAPQVPPAARRTRWSDLAVRATAVAAVLVGAIAVLPAPALAEDVSLSGILAIREVLAQPVEVPLLPRGLTAGAEISPVTATGAAGTGLDSALIPLAAGAVALFAAGLVLRRRP